MICIIALVVLSITGIFSASHRRLAKEAFDCVFKKVTLRKCDTGFDDKIKAKIVGKTMGKNPKLAGFIFRRFQILSWILTILLLVSLIFTVHGAYNFIRYGNCNGAHSDELCIFNPLGGDDDVNCGSQHCEDHGCDCGDAEINCNEDNNYAACNGSCDCYEEVCG